MAEKLAELKQKGGGGSLTETTLWTNSSPTSTYPADQTVTLSQAITNFDFIKFNYKPTTSSSVIKGLLVDASEFPSMLNNNDVCNPNICAKLNTGVWCRRIHYVSDTQVYINGCSQQYGTGVNQNNCIPTSIVGVKA